LKILIIRLSSIGDIILTTPVIRWVKNAYPTSEIDFITKSQFVELLNHHPSLSHVFAYSDQVLQELKASCYDLIIDLHKNIRTNKIISAIKSTNTKLVSFDKLNWEKWLLVNFKINKLPNIHIVNRYAEALNKIEIPSDNIGLELFTDDKPLNFRLPYAFQVIVLGANHYTKRIPLSLISFLIENSPIRSVLIGGKAEMEDAKFLLKHNTHDAISLCGCTSLMESIKVIGQAKVVITPDTGMMHVAAALNVPIVSIWGNTDPVLGMFPYIVTNSSIVNKKIWCKPCSKLGFHSCPLVHFECMNHDSEVVLELIKQAI